MKKTVVQFLKFGLVGASNTVIGYLIYAASLKVLRLLNLWPSIDIYISQFIMFVLSVAWSFYWNNRFVFKKEEETERNLGKALIKTYVSYAFTSLILSELLLMVWVKILGVNDYVAPILSLIITVPLNFVIQKFWAFKDKKNEKEI